MTRKEVKRVRKKEIVNQGYVKNVGKRLLTENKECVTVENRNLKVCSV